MFVTQSK